MQLLPGQTYTSGPGNFTALVPPLLSPGVHQSESTAEDGSAASVSFRDDFGTLLTVQSRRFPAADPRDDTVTGNRALADQYLNDAVLPAVRRQYPGTNILHDQDPVDTAAVGPARFVVLGVPHGSPTLPGHPDATWGLLAFPRFGWTYVVTVQLWPPTPNQPPLSPTDRDDRLLAMLRQAVAQMTFH